MVLKNFKLNINNKNVEIKIKECKNILSKAIGLMFKKNESPLLFTFKKPTKTPIHSFFCRPFIAIWLLNDKIIDIKKINPNRLTIKPRQKYNKLLEVPSNNEKYIDLSTEAERFKY